MLPHTDWKKSFTVRIWEVLHSWIFKKEQTDAVHMPNFENCPIWKHRRTVLDSFRECRNMRTGIRRGIIFYYANQNCALAILRPPNYKNHKIDWHWLSWLILDSSVNVYCYYYFSNHMSTALWWSFPTRFQTSLTSSHGQLIGDLAPPTQHGERQEFILGHLGLGISSVTKKLDDELGAGVILYSHF